MERIILFPISELIRNMASPVLEQVGRVFSSAVPFVSGNGTVGESLPTLSLRSLYRDGFISWASLYTFLALWTGYCVTGAIYRCMFLCHKLSVILRELELRGNSVL